MTIDPSRAPKGAGRYGWTWRKTREAAYRRDKRADAPCWICGKPIDYEAPAGTPDAWEPDHFLTVDEAPQYANDLANIRPSHSSCNRARGAIDGNRKRARERWKTEIGEPSQDWGLDEAI